MLLFLWCLCSHCLSSHPSAPIMACQLDFLSLIFWIFQCAASPQQTLASFPNLVFFLLCPRCSSGYVCPTGMRAPPLESFCDGGDCSVRGGVTGSAARLSPHPCPPRPPKSPPLPPTLLWTNRKAPPWWRFSDKVTYVGYEVPPSFFSHTSTSFSILFVSLFFVCFWSVNLCPHWLSWSSKNEPSPWGEGPAFSLCTQLWGIPLLMW